MVLVYICSGKSSVIDSQVLALLKYYSENNIFEQVILVFGYHSKDDLDWLKSKVTFGIAIIPFKTYPNYPFLNYFIRKSLKNAIKKILTDKSNCFFHIRGEMISYQFKNAMPKLGINPSQLLSDVRGTSIEEVNEYLKLNFILKKLKIWNYYRAFKSLHKDKKISVVSKSLKSHLVSSFGLNEKSISVVSCLVDENFSFNEKLGLIKRKELKISKSDILVVFASGGTAGWQKNDLILKLADKGYKVLNLSKSSVEHENIITRFVPYSHMPQYLSSADVAFIWRDESLVNRVASPVKFSEYISCGLPIIHNGTVDLINEVTKKFGSGLFVKDINNLKLDEIKNFINSINRNKLSNQGKALFGLKRTSEQYKRIYFNGEQ